MAKLSGIYCIENIVNGKKYIGCAVDIHARISRHKNELKKGIHDNNYLQRVYNKYGGEIFKYWIVQDFPKDLEKLKNMEIYWIAYYNSFFDDGGGYNLTRGGDGRRGYKMSDYQKEQISKMNKDRKHTEEEREKMRGRIKSPEEIEKMAASKRGKPSYNKGIPMLEEVKKHLSEIRTGIKLSKENCEAIARGIQGLKRHKNTSSKYVGVKWSKQKEKWISEIFFNKQRIYIGTFQYETEAALAYNEYALEYYGANAKINNISQEEIDLLWEQE